MVDELGKAFHDFYKLGNSGLWCCVKLDFDYNYAAYVELTPGFIVSEDHKVAVKVQSCEINTVEGMIEFLKLAVRKAKEYEDSVRVSKD